MAVATGMVIAVGRGEAAYARASIALIKMCCSMAEKPKPEDEDIFLADVYADPEEFTNIARDPEYADVVHQLSDQLDKHTANSVEVDPSCLHR